MGKPVWFIYKDKNTNNDEVDLEKIKFESCGFKVIVIDSTNATKNGREVLYEIATSY